ncbi:MAG: RNA pyrophosphohydrolase [Gammaproteobacteria bacterium]|jgi:putative (di)nucleoside polyphosphate hydrolase|nr:RNA pyrophosphohydrolase [Gammaproteobacteria bacterium]NBT44044.1 RNA pyrophosphohydrolase [Gammaproteobacteria bacterium]
MIDRDGYRLNVGIVLCNDERRLFWARRVGMRSWQFPQGGIKRNEEPEEAMYRELYEEVGLQSEDVELIARTSGWLHYDLPERYIRKRSYPLCIGQKQLWFMLKLVSPESSIRLDCSVKPEFDSWMWVDYWHPVEDVVYFKRDVYERALTELKNHLDPARPLSPPKTQALAGSKS